MKPTLYLLPGLLCDETVWAHQRKSLRPFADVRIPVFRGFSSFRLMALHVLRDAPPRFSVAGHSMGGRVALEMMHLFPERIDKFALLSTGVHPLQPGEATQRWSLANLAEQQGMQALADVWIPPMVHPGRHRDARLMQKIKRMVLRNTPEDYAGQITAALTRADQSRYLPAIRHEVLLMCGENDTWSPLVQHQEICRQLPSATLCSIPDAGHMVTMEQPEAVSKVLVSWFTAPMAPT
jgi:pimeloyl-ACP methyl ester carboxylesterase